MFCYEYCYDQEERWTYAENAARSIPCWQPDWEDSFYLPVRSSKTWNTAVFVGLGSIGSSSVCSEFTLASCSLYSDELSHLVNRFSTFSRTVCWPDWDTVNRHYFIQILGGVIKSALPETSWPVCLNRGAYLLGQSFPVLELTLDYLQLPSVSQKRLNKGDKAAYLQLMGK